MRSRFITYGTAVLLVLGGGVCAASVAGTTGEILAMALIGVGLVLLTGLIFMEVGLTEDRERERERQARRAEPTRSRPPRLDPIRMPRLRQHGDQR